MNKGQENRSTMHSTVDTLPGENKSKKDEVPALAGQITILENDVAELKDELLANKNALQARPKRNGVPRTIW